MKRILKLVVIVVLLFALVGVAVVFTPSQYLPQAVLEIKEMIVPSSAPAPSAMPIPPAGAPGLPGAAGIPPIQPVPGAPAPEGALPAPAPEAAMPPAAIAGAPAVNPAEAQFRQFCTEEMTKFALSNNTDPQQYIDANQAYLQQCIDHNLQRNAAAAAGAPTDQPVPAPAQ